MKPLAALAIASIRTYRKCISPLLGPHCRFHPSCSCYGEAALRRFGFFPGAALTLFRLLRCHPLHPGGIDQVPTEFPRRPWRSNHDPH